MMFIYGHISRYAGAKFKQFLRWKMKNVNKFFLNILLCLTNYLYFWA